MGDWKGGSEGISDLTHAGADLVVDGTDLGNVLAALDADPPILKIRSVK